jgi:hypothetical protein
MLVTISALDTGSCSRLDCLSVDHVYSDLLVRIRTFGKWTIGPSQRARNKKRRRPHVRAPSNLPSLTSVLRLCAVRMTAGAFGPVHLALFAAIAAVSIFRGVGALTCLVLAFHDLVPSQIARFPSALTSVDRVCYSRFRRSRNLGVAIFHFNLLPWLAVCIPLTKPLAHLRNFR